MPKKFASVRVLLLVTTALLVYLAGFTGQISASYCVPNGQWDDVLEETDCCSGYAEPGSTWCINEGDYGTTWYSCFHLCAENPAPTCSPSCCNPPWDCSCCDGVYCPCY
jgi:hypothetical protein